MHTVVLHGRRTRVALHHRLERSHVGHVHAEADVVGSAGINECADVARDRREDFLAFGRGKPMGDVVNLVGSAVDAGLMPDAAVKQGLQALVTRPTAGPRPRDD